MNVCQHLRERRRKKGGRRGEREGFTEKWESWRNYSRIRTPNGARQEESEGVEG